MRPTIIVVNEKNGKIELTFPEFKAMIDNAYDLGFEDGQKDGVTNAYETGYADGKKIADEELKKAYEKGCEDTREW